MSAFGLSRAELHACLLAPRQLKYYCPQLGYCGSFVVICLVWFQTKKPANQNHGFLKPNQTILMVSGWFWFWFEAGETKTMVSNHGFDAVFLFVIFRRQQAHFGLQIV
jgi:hypothetical protein